jgi:hypothetical protein
MSRIARWTRVAALAWLAVALAVGSSGLVAGFPPVLIAVTVWGGFAAVLAVYLGKARLRRWVRSLSPAWMATFHLWRLAPGIYFLLLYDRGQLPWRFAVPAGWGDIAVALTAPLAGFVLGTRTPQRQSLLIVWHLAGFVDLAQVVLSGMRLRLAGDTLILNLGSQFPLYLLPLYAVPITLAAHVLGVYALWPRPR